MHRPLVISLFIACLAPALRANPHLDRDGFIRTWLVFAPVPLAPGATADEALDQQQLPDEARLAPKPGDRLPVAGKQRKWKSGTFRDFIIDYNAFIGAQTDNAAGYAVTYIHCDDTVNNLTLSVGFNDFGMAFLNGRAVLRQTDGGALQQDRVSAPVTLHKGRNILILKTINESSNFQACARFKHPDGSPFTAFTIKTDP